MISAYARCVYNLPNVLLVGRAEFVLNVYVSMCGFRALPWGGGLVWVLYRTVSKSDKRAKIKGVRMLYL